LEFSQITRLPWWWRLIKKKLEQNWQNSDGNSNEDWTVMYMVASANITPMYAVVCCDRFLIPPYCWNFWGYCHWNGSNKIYVMIFETIALIQFILSQFFWNVMPCQFVNSYRRFEVS
jgi:hypothetical protein